MGAMKFPNFLHKGLLDKIIYRVALGFIYHDEGVQQEEEE